MMLDKVRPRALFGGPLVGGTPVYYIYSDEAGTSAAEPVCVVVGVIIHADRHWRAAAELLNDILDEYVPGSIREGFIFHAKDIWNGYRTYDADWPRERRAEFIGAVASIPRMLGAALSIGKVRRDALAPDDLGPMKLEDFQHLHAFGRCMARADKYVRDWGESKEVATLISEDVPSKKRFLKKALRIFDYDFPINEENVVLTESDKLAGRILQTNSGKIDRIIDTVHFVEKGEAPLLQLADACAYVFRRFFAAQSYGSEMLDAMLGDSLVWDEWQGPISNYTFSFNPHHAYPKQPLG